MAEILQKKNVVTETTEAQIAVHWREEEYYYPSAKFVGQANLSDPDVLERFSEKNYPECFREYADLLTWYKYWDKTLDTSDPPFWKWFVGGKINASYNCVDRHLGHTARTRSRSCGKASRATSGRSRTRNCTGWCAVSRMC